MSNAAFIDNAKVMAKGQITIPKDVRNALGVSNGDRVTFIVEGNTARIVNSAVYAIKKKKKEMQGAGEAAGLSTDDAIDAMIAELRNEDME